ncbi:hypothetical protein RclHR1_00820015 [Rhizophagus clarus]|uniref:Uncharacterized protein n=1 Tax=Rhizophagus clarus TaxID=94130 RepID=A0A2Z6RZL9_9GLOM|nr:hypothetical protein RclHR1_00820015 [Rhizophagus clarus]GES85681.1 hypothetical protein RCL_jg6678.t1 [Rhizophagus clarus]
MGQPDTYSDIQSEECNQKGQGKFRICSSQYGENNNVSTINFNNQFIETVLYVEENRMNNALSLSVGWKRF